MSTLPLTLKTCVEIAFRLSAMPIDDVRDVIGANDRAKLSHGVAADVSGLGLLKRNLKPSRLSDEAWDYLKTILLAICTGASKNVRRSPRKRSQQAGQQAGQQSGRAALEAFANKYFGETRRGVVCKFHSSDIEAVMRREQMTQKFLTFLQNPTRTLQLDMFQQPAAAAPEEQAAATPEEQAASQEAGQEASPAEQPRGQP